MEFVLIRENDAGDRRSVSTVSTVALVVEFATTFILTVIKLFCLQQFAMENPIETNEYVRKSLVFVDHNYINLIFSKFVKISKKKSMH